MRRNGATSYWINEWNATLFFWFVCFYEADLQNGSDIGVRVTLNVRKIGWESFSLRLFGAESPPTTMLQDRDEICSLGVGWDMSENALPYHTWVPCQMCCSGHSRSDSNIFLFRTTEALSLTPLEGKILKYTFWFAKLLSVSVGDEWVTA